MEDQKKHLALKVNKPKKKKALPQEQELGDGTKKTNKKGQKASKGAPKNESPELGVEHQALSEKYMILEREHIELGRDLQVIEDEMKILEEEKLSLLDELVVLEGLVDPSDIQHQGQSQRLHCPISYIVFIKHRLMNAQVGVNKFNTM